MNECIFTTHSIRIYAIERFLQMRQCTGTRTCFCALNGQMQCKTDYMSDLVLYKDKLETQGQKVGKETLKLILLIDDITHYQTKYRLNVTAG